MLTREQIITLKVSLKKTTLDDSSYRLLLRNIGNVDSCKALTNTTYEDVMAVLEESHGEGFYWREKVRTRGTHNDRMTFKITALFRQYEILANNAGIEPLEQYKLDGLVANASRGRTRDPARLFPWEAAALIECLKEIVHRTEAVTT